jgi:hypothetical protein
MNKTITLTESELIGVIKEIRDNIQLRRRFKEGLDENEVRMVIRVVMNDLYLEDYSNEDSFADEVMFKVTDYFFDENLIMPEDKGYNEMYDDFLSYIQDEYSGMIIRYYKSHTEDEDELYENTELTERCWKGYTQKGMKTMFGKRYPNCVKIKK